MKLEEYRKRLIELESLPWNESYRKIAEADKLSIYLGKPSPMRSTAIKFIFDARAARGITELGCFCKIGELQTSRSL